MDRKGQTWHCKTTVFTVLSSYKPSLARRYWKHTIVYLDYHKPQYIGIKMELDEAIEEPYESYKEMKRLT